MSAPAVPVLAPLPAYRAAVAGLRLSAHSSSDPRGAIVVVPGTGPWWEEAASAREAGAAAIVVADPRAAPARAVDLLRERCRGMPVVLERPRLRPDVAAAASAARAGVPARLVTVECAGLAGELGAVVRDGVGWARILAQGPLRLRSASTAPRAGMGLLELSDGGGPDAGALPVTLSANVLTGRDGGGLLRVTALGEVLTAVTVDVPAGLVRVETSTADGAFTAAPRFESPARLALRRALEALAHREPGTDLDDLRHDGALAEGLAGGLAEVPGEGSAAHRS